MLQITAHLNNKKTTTEKGFTLVELLIVIAILGVLAAVVLVAINPIEQINRAGDAGRESAVSQLGRAILNWQTSQQQSDFSNLTPASWQTVLVSANELKNQVTINSSTNLCTSNSMGGICYAAAAVGSNANGAALVWTDLSSTSEWKRAGCTGTQVAISLWDSTQGKDGITCVAAAGTVPGTGLTLH